MADEHDLTPIAEGGDGSLDNVDEPADDGGLLGRGSSRRTFLKAAALGTAAAAVFQKGPGFTLGPAAAFADDLSTFQCTANDVRILGAGQIINEPCTCSGTFNATVQFTVENNAASDRSCITLHLVAVTLPNGTVIPQTDIILNGGSPIPGKTTQVMTGTIQNYPCGSGLVCFGSPQADGRNRCGAGECSTVSWAVPGQDSCPPDRQISSKCRHQQICIQGRGVTTVDCNTTTGGNQTNCPVPCGGTTTVRVCTTSPAGLGPFTFTLGSQSFGPTTDTCHDFTVGPITANTTLTATVTDSTNCARTAQVTLTTTAITPVITADGLTDCDGIVTYTASAAGFTGCTAAWTIDGVAAANSATDTRLVRVNADGTLDVRILDGACHTIGVTLSCGVGGACSGSATTTVRQCVTSTTPCTPA